MNTKTKDPVESRTSQDAGRSTLELRPSDFLSMTISRRKLLRSDEPAHGVRGLYDPETGTRYVIGTADLLQWR